MLEFGHFRLDPDRQILWREGQLVPIGPKVVQTLAVLVANSGQVVSKDDLIQQVWGDTAVEENSLARNIFVLRKILKEDPSGIFSIETIPKRGYWFCETAQVAAAETEAEPPIAAKGRLWWIVGAAALLVTVAVAGYFGPRSPGRLTSQDTVVLSEFTNTTGDPIFDNTLRQALSSQLEQSPFVNLLSDTQIAQTLVLMAQPRDSRLTRKLAREVCQRTAGVATIEGSISGRDNQYVLELKAVNCRDGHPLAGEQVVAKGKEEVLKALGQGATRMREKLGESLLSVRKFDVPPENVTTSSLEALQAYTLGYRELVVMDDGAAAVPYFQQAISLDPNFAMAYARLGTSYYNSGDVTRAVENTRKAYERRDRVSEREKLHIVSRYEHYVTGDLHAALKAYEQWAQIYPRDAIPLLNLGNLYATLGDYDKALAATQEHLKVDPASGISYPNLVGHYMAVNRLDEAEATAREAQLRHLDSPSLHYNLYDVYFLRHDPAGMEREAAALLGKPGFEAWMLSAESDTAAYFGQFSQARELTRRAADAAERADRKETAAVYEAQAAMREALVGNMAKARQWSRLALARSRSRSVEAVAAIAMALTGEADQPSRLADSLNRRFPEDTIVQFEYLPMIRASTTLGSHNDARSAKTAIVTLMPAAPYELGFGPYPVYFRGLAYLAARQGVSAAAEFQKILDHPGVVQNDLTGALAHVGLGRAYELSRDRVKAKIAYQDFFAIWNDADPDIPIYKQAKAEYAKLP